MESVGKCFIFAGTVKEELSERTVCKILIAVGLGKLEHD